MLYTGKSPVLFTSCVTAEKNTALAVVVVTAYFVLTTIVVSAVATPLGVGHYVIKKKTHQTFSSDK